MIMGTNPKFLFCRWGSLWKAITFSEKWALHPRTSQKYWLHTITTPTRPSPTSSIAQIEYIWVASDSYVLKKGKKITLVLNFCTELQMHRTLENLLLPCMWTILFYTWWCITFSVLWYSWTTLLISQSLLCGCFWKI